MPRHTVLITGACGGLGGATARLFADRGWQVIAADLAEREPADRIVPVRLDVTDPASVANLAARADEIAPAGVAAVVNFAGILIVGTLIDVSEEDLRSIIDVNVLGTYRVNKALFEAVLRANGRIVNISSETGWQSALMLNGPYAMTKHAIEAYSDALRRELMFLGVQVIKIQPGPFRTGMVDGISAAFARAEQASTHLPALVRAVGRRAAREDERAADPAVLAEAVWTAVTTARPRVGYSVKPDRRRLLMDKLPPRVADALLRRALAPRSR